MWCLGLKLGLENAKMHPILSLGFRSIFCENIKQYFVDTLRGGGAVGVAKYGTGTSLAPALWLQVHYGSDLDSLGLQRRI